MARVRRGLETTTDFGDQGLEQGDDGPGVGGRFEGHAGVASEVVAGEVEDSVAAGGKAVAADEVSVLVDEGGFDDLLVEIDTGKCHTEFTFLWRAGRASLVRATTAGKPADQRRGWSYARWRRAEGPNGTYLFELEVQPGGPEGRPVMTAGSKPISVLGRP
jgi:hypothetical protein